MAAARRAGTRPDNEPKTGDSDGVRDDASADHRYRPTKGPTMHLDRSHPIRVLLDQAANGNAPSRQQLDALAEHDRQLPDGASLARFRDRVSTGAAELAQMRERDGGISNSLARASELAAEIGDRMTDAERSASGEANPEPLDDIARRLFPH